ncbi:coiled-coil domain-containing protein 86 [Scomber scombrus]|uniref:Coiled-coil domain-containing protein 86 n=1 Tax=Scomber scombrus TaxID=13677 RepID=A0AAV1NHD9_SCOSC
MSKRDKAMADKDVASEEGHGEEEIEDPPPETRRTRSGRRVRTPAALLDSEAPVRTPSRRTRRSVIQEVPAAEELAAEELVLTPVEEKPSVCAEPEPDPVSSAPADTDRAGGVTGNGDGHVSEPVAPETAPASSESEPPSHKKPRLGPKPNPVVPLGKPKSGRVWKDRSKQRFSAVVRDKSVCSSWEKKMEAKREKDLVKQYCLQLKDEKAKQKEDKRKRREDNLKRRAENERKSEIVQVIRNTAKIKRMKKKQLRKIEKRDTLALLQKSQKQRVKAKVQKTNTANISP